jgi:hypothetical protein
MRREDDLVEPVPYEHSLDLHESADDAEAHWRVIGDQGVGGRG